MAECFQPPWRYAAMMLGVTNPWTFLVGTVAIVLLPGPNTLFVLSVAGRFGVRAGYPAVSFLVLGLIVEVVSALYLSVLIFAGAFVASRFRARERLSRWLSTLLGAVFIGFGVRLATASLG